MGRTHTDHALQLVRTGLRSPRGEPVTTTGDLPDDLDQLLALRDRLHELLQVARQVRSEVDAKVGMVLGPGRTYEYGDNLVRWKHGYRWRADKDAVNRFVEDVARRDPAQMVHLFNPNAIRKTGVERVARNLGYDPETAVDTLLHKVWDDEPSVQFKPKDV